MKPPDHHPSTTLEMAAKPRQRWNSWTRGAAAGESFPGQQGKKNGVRATLRIGAYDSRLHLGFIRAGRELGWHLQEIREFSQDSTTPWKLEAGGHSVRLHPGDFPADMGDGIAGVGLPYEAAGGLAAAHLLGLNCPHIAFYRGTQGPGTGRLLDAFAKACANAGKSVILLAGSPSGTPAEAERFAAALRALPLPCAVLAASDDDAAALINAAAAHGISVPTELAVLGCGDHEISRAKCSPALCSIDLNHEQAAYTAAKLLHHLLGGGTLERLKWTVKPGGLIQRDTTRGCGLHPGLYHVISRIERDYAEPLAVPQLAREAGMSVRTLQRLYHAATGSAIGEDLLHQRLEGASKLLRDSDLKLEAIARMVGLGNASRLCRLFRLRFGRTPNQCRLAAAEP